MRYYGPASFKHGFDDHIGLIEGVPGAGYGNITVGEVYTEPVEEIEEDNLYEVEVKGGKLIMSPIASCSWNFTSLEFLEDDELNELEPDDIPMKDRMVETFHYLNGVTPHYFKTKLKNALYIIRRHNKLPDDEK